MRRKRGREPVPAARVCTDCSGRRAGHGDQRHDAGRSGRSPAQAATASLRGRRPGFQRRPCRLSPGDFDSGQPNLPAIGELHGPAIDRGADLAVADGGRLARRLVVGRAAAAAARQPAASPTARRDPNAHRRKARADSRRAVTALRPSRPARPGARRRKGRATGIVSTSSLRFEPASAGLIWWPAMQCGHHTQMVRSIARILTSVSLLVSIAVVTSSPEVGQR